MRKYSQIFLFVCVNCPCFAQNLEEGEKIAPDRPGFGDAVSVVSRKTMHIETGTWFEQDRGGSLVTNGIGINSTLFRYGLFKRMELRLDYNFWKSTAPAIHVSETGLYPIRAGMKYHLVYNKGIIPAITFIGMQEIQFTATANFRPVHPNTDLQLSFANKVNDRFALCYNLGTIVSEWFVRPQYYYALATEFTLSERSGCYLQAHGTLQEIKDDINSVRSYYLNYLEAGFMYYPSHNTQLDISGGVKTGERFGETVISIERHSWYFLSVGFSWRFSVKA